MKNQLNTVLAETCRQGLADSVSSAVVAGVSVGCGEQRIRAEFGGGRTRADRESHGVNLATLFDLASLTKPLCTTLLILSLVAEGRLHLDDRLAAVLDLPVPVDKKDLRVWQLLNHSAGFTPYRPYYRDYPPESSVTWREQLLGRILADPLEYSVGSESRYSDLGFMLLGRVVENRSGLPLDKVFQERLSKPLGLADDLLYLPLDRPLAVPRERIAATEACPWRGRVLQGEVHDEHCWLLGGVAGHAGLFGTLHGVRTLAEWLLDVWQGRAQHPAIPACLLRKALARRGPHSTWGLGFDTPTPGSSSSGRWFAPTSVGHLGFSGTSLWIDPEREVVAVLLTNRVHPSRDNERIRQFRPFFHDRVMGCLQAGSKWGKSGRNEKTLP